MLVKNSFTAIILTLGFSFSSAQQIYVDSKTIEYQDALEVFSICKTNPKISTNENLDYFWYNSYSGIKSTKGGFGGQLLHGKYQLFDIEGNLLNEANYHIGVKHGLSRIWESDGSIKESAKYDNGECIYMKFKNDEDYWVELIGQLFKSGSQKNVYTSYNQLVRESKCIESFKFQTKDYYEGYSDKRIKAEFTSGPGEYYYGSYKEYHTNGRLKLNGNFIENQRDGEWIFYNEDGSIKAREKYRIYQENYPTGKLKITGSQLYDKETYSWIRNGRWLFYEENGKDYKRIEEYNYGELVVTY